MTRRILHLHLGFHKTATTSIQRAFFEHADLLADHGLRYPTLPSSEPFDHNIGMSHFKKHPHRYHLHIKAGRTPAAITSFNDQLAVEFDIALDGVNDIVLSSETASLLRPERLVALRDHLQAAGFEIRVVVFVREPRQFAESWLQERIKTGRGFRKIQFFHSRSRFIPRLREIFGEHTTFIPFASTLGHEYGPVGAMFEHLGIPPPRTRGQAHNSSLSNEATRILNFANLCQPVYTKQRRNPRRRDLDFEPLQRLPGRRFSFSSEELRQFESQLQQENLAMKALLGEEFCDRSQASLSELNDDFFCDDNHFCEVLESVLPDLRHSLRELVLTFMTSSYLVSNRSRNRFDQRSISQ